MVVVAPRGEAGVDGLRRPAGDGHAEDPAAAVIDQRTAVAQPVGCLDPRGRDVNDAAIRRRDRLRLEGAVQDRRPGRDGRRRGEFHVREHRRFRHVLVVCADAQADVERLLKRDADGRPREARFFALGRQVHHHVFAPLDDAEPPGRRHVGLHFVRGSPPGLAKLQRRQPVAVQGDVDVGRIGLQALADHQARLAMLFPASADKRNVGRQREVARSLLPDIVKGVTCRPHVFAAAGDRVTLFCRVETDRPRMQNRPHVSMVFKDPNGCGSSGALAGAASDRGGV